ncbi:MAG: NYN domain-containing protein [SAR202 cluster bacterium]|nr:NYN domain-containing protein [SAR202 cluster bacterium]
MCNIHGAAGGGMLILVKAMVFIDGSWLYHCRSILRRDIGDPEFAIDYRKLPLTLLARLRKEMTVSEIDLVRVHFFASLPKGYASEDTDLVAGQQDFYDRLEEEPNYEVDISNIDFKGRRLKAEDRDPYDSFVPREKRIDVALACAVLYNAMLPGVYDVAVALIGDEDYVPALQQVRRLGKRVMIASVRGSCDEVYVDPVDPLRLRDFPTIFLNDILPEIRMDYDTIQLECQSPQHVGDRHFLTRYHPRPGERIYCDVCRARFAQERAQAEAQLGEPIPQNVLEHARPGYRVGRISYLNYTGGYGFIRVDGGGDYYFHVTNLAEIQFESLKAMQIVQFKVDKAPSPENQNRGNASEVWLLAT